MPSDTSRLLAEALMRAAPQQRKRHPMVIGEALRHAGVLEVPEEMADFRRFVKASLGPAAAELLGQPAAIKIKSELLTLTAEADDCPEDTLPLGTVDPERQPRESEPRATIGLTKDLVTTLPYDSSSPPKSGPGR